jgi:hypothetical protein
MEQVAFKQENLKIVDIKDVVPNTWNPKAKQTEEFQGIKRGIEQKGQRLPIIVRQHPDKRVKAYEILDGEQRFTACQELGFKQVLIYSEGNLSDREAKELTLWYQQQVPFDELQLAGLIKDIVTNNDYYELPYNQDQIDAFLKMDNFDFNKFKDDQDKVDKLTEYKEFTLQVTKDQLAIIEQAIDLAKSQLDNDNSFALTHICNEYLQNHNI